MEDGTEPGTRTPSPAPSTPGLQAYVGHEAGLHLLLTQLSPQHVGQRGGRLHVPQAGHAVPGAHGEQLEQGPGQPGAQVCPALTGPGAGLPGPTSRQRLQAG